MSFLRKIFQYTFLTLKITLDLLFGQKSSQNVNVIENPFGPKVIGVLSEKCKVCARYKV